MLSSSLSHFTDKETEVQKDKVPHGPSRQDEIAYLALYYNHLFLAQDLENSEGSSMPSTCGFGSDRGWRRLGSPRRMGVRLGPLNQAPELPPPPRTPLSAEDLPCRLGQSPCFHHPVIRVFLLLLVGAGCPAQTLSRIPWGHSKCGIKANLGALRHLNWKCPSQDELSWPDPCIRPPLEIIGQVGFYLIKTGEMSMLFLPSFHKEVLITISADWILFWIVCVYEFIQSL